MLSSISKKTLVVVAHPDDETLGAGGTIRRMAEQGVSVDVLVVTDGSSAQFGSDMISRDRRMSHFYRACEILGVSKSIALDFPDMRFDTCAHTEVNDRIMQVITDGQYDTVLTHHPGDVNLDHRSVFESVMVAVRPQPGSCVKTVATFFINSSSEWGAMLPKNLFHPTIFVDISETCQAKLDALAVYEDEVRNSPHPRSLQAVRARAETVGSEVGVYYGEAFQLIRCIDHV